mmetsp:Transcript_6938/g.11662  ORF Transcript_6938/g.11662 Transcript_6938/m.11662 type:complete len:455 (+) Transcript_6938:90-1454(+)
MQVARRIGLKAAFYRLAKQRDHKAACSVLLQAYDIGMADKHMISIGISFSARAQQRDVIDRLWRIVSPVNAKIQLNEHMCSAFINAYGCFVDHDGVCSARCVLDFAKKRSLANTSVFNAFFQVCAKAAEGSKPTLEPATAASLIDDALLAMAVEGVPCDAYSTAIAIRVHGRAGQLARAQQLLDEAGDAADTVAFNALLGAAARCGDAMLALNTLRHLGSRADLISFNTVIQAIARSEQQIDRVARAQEVRALICQAGLAEDQVTQTSLLAIYGDSPIAEELLETGECSSRSLWDSTSDQTNETQVRRLQTDLRRLTRPSAAIMLRRQLELVVDQAERGEACQTDWVIVTGSRVGRSDGGCTLNGEDGGSVRNVLSPMQEIAHAFLSANGIAYRSSGWRGRLRVSHGEMHRVATQEISTRCTRRVVFGTLGWLATVCSIITAAVVTPRVIALAK